MKFALLLFAFLPALSHAVEPKDCPNVLSITYGSVSVLADAELASPAARDERDTLMKITSKDYQGLRFYLVERTRNECHYVRDGEALVNINETSLLSVHGRDLIRVSLKVGSQNFWVYHWLARYSTSGILIDEFKAAKIIGLSGGGHHVGWAKEPYLE